VPLSDVATRLTRQDFLFPALVAFLLTISPMTGSAVLWRAAILGVAGGAIVFALRVVRRLREPASPRAVASPAPRRWPSPLGIAACAATALAFAPALVWLFQQHTDTLWRNVHGVFCRCLRTCSRARRCAAIPSPHARSRRHGASRCWCPRSRSR
jgi:hypothetical protein